MIKLILFILLLKAVNCFSQHTHQFDTIPLPKYDTVDGVIKSTNSFYFLNKLYAIPRQCGTHLEDDTTEVPETNCCDYTVPLYKIKNINPTASFSCFDGTAFKWWLGDSLNAYQNFNRIPFDLKQQMKAIKQVKVNFKILGQPMLAYKLTCTTKQDYNYVMYIFFGAVENTFIQGTLSIQSNITSSKIISYTLQQIIDF